MGESAQDVSKISENSVIRNIENQDIFKFFWNFNNWNIEFFREILYSTNVIFITYLPFVIGVSNTL